ncbi:DUF6209 family protein [Nostoc sp. XA010]|uniref:DUF6209 family protein n=1 Tax=Nostoc sp. XA010 TaxID=2780407 RepID=UPI001E49561C|nr:DUF6209 family protein [Nostoc sp. XA010]MCC5661584.1 DUF6209 family protein [Nostoc sp. XA010]
MKTTINFTKDWQEILTGELTLGGKFTINYDESRLPYFRTIYRGLPSWQIDVGLQFENNGQVQYKLLRQGQNNYLPPVKIDIPINAQKVNIWFENYGYDPYDTSGNNDTRCYDSNYGKNYRFQLS